MTDLDRRVLLGLAGLAGAAAVTQMSKAGSLNPPPGPVAPTGNTTDQIEPRIDLLNAPASANVTSDANNHYVINNAGSYYLSANLSVSKPAGILINAPGVTLDLSGFEVSGSGTQVGIKAAATLERIAICNGTMRDLDRGIEANTAYVGRFSHLAIAQCAYAGLMPCAESLIEACVLRNNGGLGVFSNSQVGRAIVSDCVADSNGKDGFYFLGTVLMTRCIASNNRGSSGITAGDRSKLTDCLAVDNGPGSMEATAILAFDYAVLTRCVAVRNQATFGISVGTASIVADCIASLNVASATSSRSGGFYLAASSVARSCTSASNSSAAPPTGQTGMGFFMVGSEFRVEDCSVLQNTGDGICVGDPSNATPVAQCRIARCEANENGFDGIHVVGSDVSVIDNRCLKNGGSGVYVQSGSSNIIRGNEVLGNTSAGLQIDSAVCCAYGNVARGNSPNYSIVAGNRIGTIVAPATNASAISGNSGGSAFSTDPYANVAF